MKRLLLPLVLAVALTTAGQTSIPLPVQDAPGMIGCDGLATAGLLPEDTTCRWYVCGALLLHPEDSATVDTARFPNWRTADQSEGIHYRYSDTWCDIAAMGAQEGEEEGEPTDAR